MSELIVLGGPGVPASLIVNGNDHFPCDHSVSESKCSPVTFETAINHEAGDQTFMNVTHVANRVPNKFRAPINADLFVDCRHDGLPGNQNAQITLIALIMDYQL